MLIHHPGEKKEERKCENCAFFHRETTIESYDGECRYNPPEFYFIGNIYPVCGATIVNPDNSCRHHQHKTHPIPKCDSCAWSRKKKDFMTCHIEPPIAVVIEGETEFKNPDLPKDYGCGFHFNEFIDGYGNPK